MTTVSMTATDTAATEWRINDEVVRFREWGTDIIHWLPAVPTDSTIIHLGTAETCALQVVDPSGWTSRKHARLARDTLGWIVRNLSKNGVRIDGARRAEFRVYPGLELGIGGLTLVAESRCFIELRSFVARLLGWAADKATEVDFALRAIRLAATRRVPLVLYGAGDLVAIAQAIHRHVLGDAKPFVVCDPRRRDGEASVRSAGNMETGLAALKRATGGSLCVWSRRLPHDFADVRPAMRDPDERTHLVVCAESRRHIKPYHVEPIVIPPLTSRPQEIMRIIDEYADEAAAAMSATVHLTTADRDWLLRHSASSISEIAKGAHRLLAIRQYDDNIAAAARALGMASISLSRWICRRSLHGRRGARG